MFRLRFCVTAHRIQHLKYTKISTALDLVFWFFQRYAMFCIAAIKDIYATVMGEKKGK